MTETPGKAEKPEGAATPAPAACDDAAALHGAESWIFDLDNTLYPARCSLFDQVDRRMGHFISERLGVARDEARRIQKRYFHEYGTTLSGLMDRHGVDPHEFLDFVHDIDYSPIEPDRHLDAALSRLSGRKLVFTNGTVAHADAVMERLGVRRHFETVFDIAAAEFVPKPRPDPYRKLVAEHAIRPQATVMVEDIAKNLEAPAAMGMRTVWVRTEHAWSGPGVKADADTPPAPYVHHVTDDLGRFLHAVLDAAEAAPAPPAPAGGTGYARR